MKKLTHIVKQFVSTRPELLSSQENPEENSDAEQRQRRAAIDQKKAEREADTRTKMFARSAKSLEKTQPAASTTIDSTFFSRCSGVELPSLAPFERGYEAMASAEEGFGRLGQARLGGNKGRDFRKEKTKLKNKEFMGGSITKQSNLVDIDI